MEDILKSIDGIRNSPQKTARLYCSVRADIFFAINDYIIYAANNRIISQRAQQISFLDSIQI